MTLAQRQLVAHLVMIAAAIIGAWVAIFQPMQHELAVLAQDAAGESNASGDPQARALALAQEATRLRNAVARLSGESPLNDPAVLYGEIHALSERAGVALHGLTPGRAPLQPDHDAVRSVRFSADVEGDFSSITSFVRGITDLDERAQVVSLYITTSPSPGEVRLRAQVEGEVLRITPSAEVERLIGPAGEAGADA
jgi:hypothetical protein